MLRYGLCLAIAFGGISTALAGDQSEVGKFALVVGISDYPGTMLDLPLVTEDARAVTTMLTQQLGFPKQNVLELQSEHATRVAILNGIRDFLGQAGDSDVAVFYYSGHGTRLKGNVAVTGAADPEVDGRDEALVAYDELLVDDEIAYALDSIRAGRLLVLFDSCHSGDATRADLSRGMPKFSDIEVVSKYIDLPSEFELPAGYRVHGDGESGSLGSAPSEGRLFIAASGEDELSWVSPTLGKSVFTYFLTDRMQQAGDESFEELLAEISPRVNQFAEQYFQVPQTAHLEGSPGTARTKVREFFQ